MGGTGARVEARQLGGNGVLRRRPATTLASVLSTFAICAAVLAPPASATAGHLAGTWTSVDVDGSSQAMRIKGAGNPVYAISLRDDFTTGVCGGPPAKVVGRAVVDGNELLMRGTLICLHRGNPFPGERTVLSFEYHAGTDTLTDSFDVVWVRRS